MNSCVRVVAEPGTLSEDLVHEDILSVIERGIG
jgi:hypothetical protein